MAGFGVVIETYHVSPLRNPSLCNNAVADLTGVAVQDIQIAKAVFRAFVGDGDED
ncbi:MAG: hypothetical protein HC840_03645 [Leptolyngbyaceae cyanobacterium RM2_2_4]|nr:hypothetical protein [Leptolyngbyaceae cyanobacterium SM1_4_3]NJN89429.1 hypothetical protein [Leptolyngbyaceae cyanobacterium SL_5_14]NJO48713.1 hypothetical protein [Leptolyngbyaceae cyanobacterium RM2_2_4]